MGSPRGARAIRWLEPSNGFNLRSDWGRQKGLGHGTARAFLQTLLVNLQSGLKASGDGGWAKADGQRPTGKSTKAQAERGERTEKSKGPRAKRAKGEVKQQRAAQAKGEGRKERRGG